MSYAELMRYILRISVTCFMLAGCNGAETPDESTRENLISGYGKILKSWDKDEDEKLSQAEVANMVDMSFPKMDTHQSGNSIADDIGRIRQELIGYYANEDHNKDGYLTIDELLKGPLSTFDCMDKNRDGRVSPDEASDAFDKCPSAKLQHYGPKQ